MQPAKRVQRSNYSRKRSKFSAKLEIISEEEGESESDSSDLSINDYNENVSISDEQNSIRLNHDFGAADIEEKILIA